MFVVCKQRSARIEEGLNQCTEGIVTDKEIWNRSQNFSPFSCPTSENISSAVAPSARGRGGSGGWLRVKGLAQHEQSHPSSQSEHPATADRQVTVTPASIYCHAVLFALQPRGHDVCDLLLKGKIV